MCREAAAVAVPCGMMMSHSMSLHFDKLVGPDFENETITAITRQDVASEVSKKTHYIKAMLEQNFHLLMFVDFQRMQ